MPPCPHRFGLCPSNYSDRAGTHGPTWRPIGSTYQVHIGWALQGPANLIQTQHASPFTVTCFKSELLRNVERLWQIDTFPYANETRSKQDKLALDLLHSKTIRVETDGVMRYATPLLRAPNSPVLKAPKEAVLPRLCATERRLSKDLKLSDIYEEELNKLVQGWLCPKDFQ